METNAKWEKKIRLNVVKLNLVPPAHHVHLRVRSAVLKNSIV